MKKNSLTTASFFLCFGQARFMSYGYFGMGGKG